MAKLHQRLFKLQNYHQKHVLKLLLSKLLSYRKIFALVCSVYVLVQLLCKTGKKNTQYCYVGLCQSDMDEDGEVRVQFMTTVDGKRFTKIVNDIADVQFDDIIAKLEAPKKKTDANNMFIEFSAIIDVFKKKLI